MHRSEETGGFVLKKNVPAEEEKVEKIMWIHAAYGSGSWGLVRGPELFLPTACDHR